MWWGCSVSGWQFAERIRWSTYHSAGVFRYTSVWREAMCAHADLHWACRKDLWMVLIKTMLFQWRQRNAQDVHFMLPTPSHTAHASSDIRHTEKKGTLGFCKNLLRSRKRRRSVWCQVALSGGLLGVVYGIEGALIVFQITAEHLSSHDCNSSVSLSWCGPWMQQTSLSLPGLCHAVMFVVMNFAFLAFYFIACVFCSASDVDVDGNTH